MTQWLDLVHQHAPWLSRQRATALLAIVAVVAAFAMAAAFGPWRTEPKVALFEGHQFREAELLAIQAAFASRQLDDWECEQRRLLAPRSRRNDYLRAAEQAGVLPEQLHDAAPMLSTNLLDTREVREEKRRRALQSELVSLVQALRGVEDATVRYSEETIRGLHRRTDRRVLVAVRCVGDAPVTGMQIQAIQATIVASVAGLRSEDVTVTDLNYATAWNGLPQQDSAAPYSLPAEPAADRVTNVEPSPAPARSKSLDSQQRAQQWAHAVSVALQQLPGVHVAIDLPTLPSPSAHPAVHVRGDRSLAVKLSVPAATLKQHFGASAPAGQWPQIAAERLQPVVERALGRPVAVYVAPSAVSAEPQPSDAASKSPLDAPLPVPTDELASKKPRPPSVQASSMAPARQPNTDSTAGWILSALALVAFGWLLQRSTRKLKRLRRLGGPNATVEIDPTIDRISNRVAEFQELGAIELETGPEPDDVLDSTASDLERPVDCLESPAGDSFRADHMLWVETLERERPQVIAAVLSQMPPAEAALILEGMCDDLSSDVLRRIGEMGDVADEVRDAMCAALAESLEVRRRIHERRAAGEAAVEAIRQARAVDSTSTANALGGVDSLEGIERSDRVGRCQFQENGVESNLSAECLPFDGGIDLAKN